MLAVAGGGAVPPTCSVFCSVVHPVSTAAALIVALRIKNRRRSTPAGTSLTSTSMNVLSSVRSVFMFTPSFALRIEPRRGVKEFSNCRL